MAGTRRSVLSWMRRRLEIELDPSPASKRGEEAGVPRDRQNLVFSKSFLIPLKEGCPLIPLKEEGLRGMSDAEEGTGEADTEGGLGALKGGQLHERDGAVGGPGMEEEEREEEKGEKQEEKQEGSLENDGEAVVGNQASSSSMG